MAGDPRADRVCNRTFEHRLLALPKEAGPMTHRIAISVLQPVWWRRLLVMVIKELRQLFRDKALIGFFFCLPGGRLFGRQRDEHAARQRRIGGA